MTLPGGGSRSTDPQSPARFRLVRFSKPAIDPRAFVLAASACLVACAARAPEPAPVVAIAGGAPVVVAVGDPEPRGAASSPPLRPWVWEMDEPRARARAAQEGVPLVVHLSAAWSAASIAMAREVWSDPRIQLQRTPLVALRIDLTDETPDAELWAARYGVSTVPTTLVLDADGREVARLLGACTVEEVLAAIRKAAADP
ncbi:thioredoxin family protein [Polyangium sorediatum]|uniref:Thioredoxin family protein n=1 Tax=Polyangium sorediatum TaxID=889274 RepID=A0ABT6P0G4_9BACT|nr:thioredoxin family protein [Polyangium sorediatum]MDI1434089.1 thioredoxin family protein [Polyangium sorediatum]